MAELAALPGDDGMTRIYGGELLSLQSYQRVISTRATALRWKEKAQYRFEIGSTYFWLSQAAIPFGLDQPPLVEAAESELRAGLTLSPVNGNAWMYLTELGSLRGDPGAAVRTYLMMMRTNPTDPQNAYVRATTGLDFWDQLDEGMRLRLGREFVAVLSSKDDRARFIEGVLQAGMLGRVRESIGDDPDGQEKLQEALGVAQDS